MKSIILIPVLSFVMSSAVTVSAQQSFNISDEITQALNTKREIIKKWAPLAADGSQTHGTEPFGDMTIFSGMGCLSGELARCDDVRRSQGPDGRWWRSPQLVGNDNEENTFSRDQALGALSYLVATRDTAAALKWQNYIESNGMRMCNIKNATDNRCQITMGISQVFGATWEYLGLPLPRWMNRGIWIAKYYNQIEALIQPADFPMHLNALSAYIRLEIERRGGPKVDSVDQKVLKILVKREPENPFFLLLRNGPTNEVAKIILDKCPDIRPNTNYMDWAWQRSQKTKDGQEPVWKHASGHDCIFIINVFERELSLVNKSVN